MFFALRVLCAQVDIITVTRANCAARMNYFEQMLITLLVFKAIVVSVLFLTWLEPKVKKRIKKYRKVCRHPAV